MTNNNDFDEPLSSAAVSSGSPALSVPLVVSPASAFVSAVSAPVPAIPLAVSGAIAPLSVVSGASAISDFVFAASAATPAAPSPPSVPLVLSVARGEAPFGASSSSVSTAVIATPLLPIPQLQRLLSALSISATPPPADVAVVSPGVAPLSNYLLWVPCCLCSIVRPSCALFWIPCCLCFFSASAFLFASVDLGLGSSTPSAYLYLCIYIYTNMFLQTLLNMINLCCVFCE
jgi:hypothetical protein